MSVIDTLDGVNGWFRSFISQAMYLDFGFELLFITLINDQLC